MKAARFEYIRVSSVSEALGLIQASDGAVKLMAGSQSLGPMLNLRLARPEKIIDISSVDELRTVTESGNTLRIGAAVTHAEIEDGLFPLLHGHMMQPVAGRIAYRAIRNRGTVGGSLAHADPAADWVLVAAALGAEIEIVSLGGVRRVPMPAFMQGAYTTEAGADELITAMHIPKFQTGTRWGYYKFCRKPGEFAEASCAAYFDLSTRTARIAVGALNGPPQLLTGLADRIAAQGLQAVDREFIHAAVEAITPDKAAVDRKLYVTVVERCLSQALGE